MMNDLTRSTISKMMDCHSRISYRNMEMLTQIIKNSKKIIYLSPMWILMNRGFHNNPQWQKRLKIICFCPKDIIQIHQHKPFQKNLHWAHQEVTDLEYSKLLWLCQANVLGKNCRNLAQNLTWASSNRRK